MLIEKVNKFKIETHHLLHLVGMLQFIIYEHEENDSINIQEVLKKVPKV